MESSTPREVTYRRHALMALDVYLGRTNEAVAKQYDTAAAYVSKIRKRFDSQREEILRTYFMSGAGETGREAVASEYARATYTPVSADAVDWQPAIENAVEILREAIGRRIESLEQKLDSILEAARSAPPQAAPAIEVATAPSSSTSSEPNDERRDYPTGDIRREDFRLSVSHQAHGQWLKLFGSGTAAGSGVAYDASETDIRRRIIGVYYAGTINGSGAVWTITGINRYAMEGVRLKCVLDRDCVYISQVEKVPLSEL